mmetsp:Transcript_39239/g.85348  ORF Transcript_39239/g.85348 Transcript_39239/m.85348 type:complete len:214 (+) Transcript_39239:762-1403(+)
MQRARELLPQLPDAAPAPEDAGGDELAEVSAEGVVDRVVEPVVHDHNLRLGRRPRQRPHVHVARVRVPVHKPMAERHLSEDGGELAGDVLGPQIHPRQLLYVVHPRALHVLHCQHPLRAQGPMHRGHLDVLAMRKHLLASLRVLALVGEVQLRRQRHLEILHQPLQIEPPGPHLTSHGVEHPEVRRHHLPQARILNLYCHLFPTMEHCAVDLC